MIVAIDGPAGSGKSTIAREAAKRLGMHYLDTGAMYRTVTLVALEAGLMPERISEIGELAAKTDLRFVDRPDDLTRAFIGDREVTDDIRGRLVSQNVSVVSAQPAVRALLTARQRQQAARGDVVLEGRDTGTVVFPDADVKVFLTASIEERARRRREQLLAQGIDQPVEELMADIATRDAYDSGRALAPLRKAEDALEIDTTGMTISEVLDTVCALVEAKRASSRRRPAGEKWAICRMVRSPLDTGLYRFAYAFVPALWRLIFRMEVRGRENIPLTGSILLVSNHRSNLDPFFLGSAFPRQVHFMAKAELWKVSLLGRVINRLGSFPVSRGEADRNAVKRALEMLRTGAVVGMFPEGHRQRGGHLGEIHGGVSLFSLREGVVTIPVMLEGTERVVRKGLLRLPRVTVTFGAPLQLPAGDMSRSQRAEVVAKRLTEALEGLLDKTAEIR